MMSSENEQSPPPKIDWNDPSVPIGNAPPMSRWPIVAWALAFAGWVVFLAVMAFA